MLWFKWALNTPGLIEETCLCSYVRTIIFITQLILSTKPRKICIKKWRIFLALIWSTETLSHIKTLRGTLFFFFVHRANLKYRNTFLHKTFPSRCAVYLFLTELLWKTEIKHSPSRRVKWKAYYFLALVGCCASLVTGKVCECVNHDLSFCAIMFRSRKSWSL